MKKEARFNIIKKIVLLGFIILLSILARINFKDISNLDLSKIIVLIEGNGVFSAIIYLLLFLVKPIFIFIPANIMAVAAGIVFGPIIGFTITMIGFFISGTIAFYLSRFLGRDFVERIIGKKGVKLDKKIDEDGFKILLLMRLPPILPYDPLSYACGLSKISYKNFILASLIGVTPETIGYSIIGNSLHNPIFYKVMLIIILIIMVVILLKNLVIKEEL